MLNDETTMVANDIPYGGVPAAGDPAIVPLMGDWDGNGVTTIGLYDPKTSIFYLKNSNVGGYADIAFCFYPGGCENHLRPSASTQAMLAIAGDWDGDGITTVGLYNPATSHFYLINVLREPALTEITDTPYGAANAGWLPLAGDWNGDGKDSIGLYEPATGEFLLSNSITATVNDVYVTIPAANPYLAYSVPIAGDWDGDGITNVGLYYRNPDSSTGNSNWFFMTRTNVKDSAIWKSAKFGVPVSGVLLLPVAGVW